MLKQRRTQKERSESTRRKVVSAAVECLCEKGLARLTTTEVCKRAGTSQGSIFKHFANKDELIAAAVESLYEELIARYRQAIVALPANANRVDTAIDALWGLFQTPQLLAVYELHIAARTDSALRGVVAPMEKAHRAKIRELAASIFPQRVQQPDFLRGVEIIINSVQGAAVGSMALREPEVIEQMIIGLKEVAHHFLEPPQ